MADHGGAEGTRPELDAYRRKRSADRTPEPFTEAAGGPGAGPVFVVQRHSARRLHYDLRLERDGVLASWAVPKGLPTSPGGRRLAVHTEDHPMSYAFFEGVIPAGQYGAGTMDVYDRGTWEPVEERRDGGLTFRLHGARLRGTWTLVPARLDGEERNWLLLRRATDGAHAAPEHETPRYEPMLATLATELPTGDDWLYEVKWDGYRVLARLDDGEPDLWSRSGRDNRERFAAVGADLGRGLRSPRVVVDGEICALDEDGRPSFQLLQNGRGTLVYYVFDLLELEGERLHGLPLEERRSRLEALVDDTSATVRFSRAFPDGQALMDAARARGLEGVVAKRRGSTYLTGRRSPEWRKLKVRLTETFAVVGWTRGEGSRERLGSLVLGARTPDDDLVWVGHVGSGLAEAEIDRLLERLAPLERARSALDRPARDPRLRRGRVTWVDPELRALVEFSEWTDDGRVRAPVYRGLVEGPGDIARVPSGDDSGTPEPVADDAPEAGVDRPLADGDDALVAYARRMADVMVAHLRGRPLTVAPLGRRRPLAPPDAVVAAGDDVLALARTGSLDLRVSPARRTSPDEADVVAFELRPGDGAAFDVVAGLARAIRDALAGLSLRAYVKTDGASGLDVWVPVAPGLRRGAARAFADTVAEAVARAFPAEAATGRRKPPVGRVLVATVANDADGTVVAPYAVRGGASARVSCPLTWDDLDEPPDPATFTPEQVLVRVQQRGDLFAPVLEGGQDVARFVPGAD